MNKCAIWGAIHFTMLSSFFQELKIDEHPTFVGWWNQRRLFVYIFSLLVVFDAIITYLAIYIWGIGTEQMPISASFMNIFGGLGFVALKIGLAFGMPLFSYLIYTKYWEVGSEWELCFERLYWVPAIIFYSAAAINSFYQITKYMVN